jgi:hypothetical protein
MCFQGWASTTIAAVSMELCQKVSGPWTDRKLKYFDGTVEQGGLPSDQAMVEASIGF